MWLPKEEIPYEVPAGPISEKEYFIGGWFTLKANDEDFRNFQKGFQPYTSCIHLMESAPMQFEICSLTHEQCLGVRKILDTLEYIGRFGECKVKPESAPEPLEPVKKEL